jgi:hypothetical protein
MLHEHMKKSEKTGEIQVYQNSRAKLQERTPHIETRNKVYDNMGPEMHNYRVIRPFSNVLHCLITWKTYH